MSAILSNTLSKLTDGYKQSCYWFELFECTRMCSCPSNSQPTKDSSQAPQLERKRHHRLSHA